MEVVFLKAPNRRARVTKFHELLDNRFRQEMGDSPYSVPLLPCSLCMGGAKLILPQKAGLEPGLFL